MVRSTGACRHAFWGDWENLSFSICRLAGRCGGGHVERWKAPGEICVLVCLRYVCFTFLCVIEHRRDMETPQVPCGGNANTFLLYEKDEHGLVFFTAKYVTGTVKCMKEWHLQQVAVTCT